MRGPATVADRAGRRSLWWMSLGAGFVVLGGLLAAVTGPLDLAKGSWLTAYLVLVCGVPQYAMGRIEARGGVRAGWVLLVCWNVANAAVVAGTLSTAPYLVDVGGAVLVVPLVIVLRAALSGGSADAIARIRGAARWLLVAALIVLIISIPVGLVLAHLRAG